MPEDYTMAEVVRALDRIERGQESMRDEFKAALTEMVRRDTWEAKNLSLDREIKEIKEQMKRPPVWPSILAVGVSVLTAAMVLIQNIT